MGQVPCANSFRRAPSERLERFGKGVSEKAFYLEVPWGVPCLFQRQKEHTWEHKVRATSNSFSETPFLNTRTYGHNEKNGQNIIISVAEAREFSGLDGACLATDDKIFATGSDSSGRA